VEGRAVEQLEYITNKSLSTEANDLYTQWLECQTTL